jgi:hypothetical protein
MSLCPHQHLPALTNELTKGAAIPNKTTKGKQLLRMLQDCIMAMLTPLPTQNKQRVVKNINQQIREAEQRAIDEAPIITILRITNAPGIMKLRNPTNKRLLKTTPRTHRHVTRNNIPGVISAPIALATYMLIPSGARKRIVTRHAINTLMCNECKRMNLVFPPTLLLPPVVEHAPSHIQHFALPMVHPVTSESISSYKKSMNNPVTSKVWQTAFGKDFRGMAQGNNKTGQKGKNAMFVMTHDEIKHVSLMEIQLLIIGCKKRIQIEFA